MSADEAYRQLVERSRSIAMLGSIKSVLGWDERCMMPERGAEHRGRQHRLLAELAHARRTDPQVGEWLAACEEDASLTADPHSVTAVNIRHLRRSYDQATRLPAELVADLASHSSRCYAIWNAARARKSFADFRDDLALMVDLARRKADCLGYDDEPYDALLDSFEHGARGRQIEALFRPLGEDLRALLDELGDPEPVNLPPGPWDRGVQEELGRRVVAALGFDLSAGRIDATVHPFCTTLGPGDVRLTTRYHDHDLLDALSSTLHEAGHGIYNQGLVAEHYGTPMGSPIGLAIHESQSRLYENQVGRSPAFARWLLPQLQDLFGARLQGVHPDQLATVLNTVRPGAIRVDSDEVHYNLHIILRFDIERALINGDLAVEDLPAAWNARFAELFGFAVTDDAEGCLQDVHWSGGAFGYFPTYTLGNLYGAQFFAAARRAIPDLEAGFGDGDFAPLRAWLGEHIHAQGCRYDAAELCRVVTGADLSPAHLLAHLRERYLPASG